EVQPALEPEHAEEDRARCLLVHDPGGRRAAAQRVVDEAGNRGAIARAGKAMRKPPVLEGIDGRAAARGDIGEHLDRGGQAGGRRHPCEGPYTSRKGATRASTLLAEIRVMPCNVGSPPSSGRIG